MLSEHSTSASLADPLIERAPDTRAPQKPAALLSVFCGKRGRRWLPFLDTYRTMCFAPSPEFRLVLEEVRQLVG
jgi:hypothetical protein